MRIKRTDSQSGGCNHTVRGDMLVLRRWGYIGAVFLLVGCGTVPATTTHNQTSVTTSRASSALTSNNSTSAASADVSSFPKTVHVGELIYTVLDLSSSTYVTDTMGNRVQAPTGDIYLLVHMTVSYPQTSPNDEVDAFINEDSGDPNFPSMLELKSLGKLYYPDMNAQDDLNIPQQFGGLGGFSVNLGGSETGYIVFDVPKTAHDYQLGLRSDDHRSAKSVWISLPTN